MKVSHLVIPFTLSLLASAVHADADVYGRVAVGATQVNLKNAVTTANRPNSELAIEDLQSRIGFKGKEDLADGLVTAIFQIESGLSADGNGDTSANNGYGSLASRNTFVGLTNPKYGTVKFGRDETPFRTTAQSFNPFEDNSGIRQVLGLNGVGSRQDNAISYESPKFLGGTSGGGVSFKIQNGSLDDKTIAKNASKSTAASVNYTSDLIKAGLAVEQSNYNKSDSRVASDLKNTQNALIAASVQATSDVVLGALYRTSEVDTNDAGTSSAKDHQYALTASYQHQQAKFLASYLVDADSSDIAKDDSAKGFIVGAQYFLSKQSKVFAQYTQIKNGAASKIDWTGNSTSSINGNASAGNGSTVSALTIGIRKDF